MESHLSWTHDDDEFLEIWTNDNCDTDSDDLTFKESRKTHSKTLLSAKNAAARLSFFPHLYRNSIQE
jgi:hypothetical protein